MPQQAHADIGVPDGRTWLRRQLVLREKTVRPESLSSLFSAITWIRIGKGIGAEEFFDGACELYSFAPITLPVQLDPTPDD